MSRKSALISLAVLAAVIGILHSAALRHHFYWTVAWYDFMMHFLGGVFVASFALWLAHTARMRSVPSLSRHAAYSVAIGVTFAVGVLWEIFEYVFGVSFIGKDVYAADTTFDLGMDLLGALAVSLLYMRRMKRNPNAA